MLSRGQTGPTRLSNTNRAKPAIAIRWRRNRHQNERRVDFLASVSSERLSAVDIPSPSL